MTEPATPAILKRRRDQKRRRFDRLTGKPAQVLPHELAEARRILTAANNSGMADSAIATSIGIHRTNVTAIIRGRRTTVYRDTYNAILGLRPAAAPPGCGSLVPAFGTTRRLRALTVVGYSGVLLAELMGVTQKFISARTVSDDSPVFSSKRDLVADWYEKLVEADPLDFGETPVGKSQAAARARRNRYAGPGCWDQDTIDDQRCNPEWTGVCGTTEGFVVHRRERIPLCQPCKEAKGRPPLRAEISGEALKRERKAHRMTACQLAEIVGVSSDSVFRWESGERSPKSGTFDRIAAVLGVPVSDLEKR